MDRISRKIFQERTLGATGGRCDSTVNSEPDKPIKYALHDRFGCTSW